MHSTRDSQTSKTSLYSAAKDRNILHSAAHACTPRRPHNKGRGTHLSSRCFEGCAIRHLLSAPQQGPPNVPICLVQCIKTTPPARSSSNKLISCSLLQAQVPCTGVRALRALACSAAGRPAHIVAVNTIGLQYHRCHSKSPSHAQPRVHSHLPAMTPQPKATRPPRGIRSHTHEQCKHGIRLPNTHTPESGFQCPGHAQ